jgi:site-specific DNA-methyltransferase (adenine-specific)
LRPAIELEGATVYLGDCREVLRTLPDNSVDSVVTDPPYELGFMGKKWDSSGIAYDVDVWQQCLRVLKPGGHLLAFGGSRTWHRLAVAIEDAGFEVRDSIAWIYGSGFPKSLDVAKAIDKASGYEGEVVGTETVDVGIQSGSMHAGRSTNLQEREVRELSPEAKQWQGWGTALKPAHEPIVVARKPLSGMVASNVLEWGVGGLNIHGSRIKRADGDISVAGNRTATFGTQETQTGGDGSGGWSQDDQGRWPANVIFDEVTAGLLDEQSGVSKSPSKGYSGGKIHSETAYAQDSYTKNMVRTERPAHGDTGGASRFFYVAKASKRDRNEGLDELEGASSGGKGNGLARVCETCGASILKPCECTERSFVNPAVKNFHPTVKPTALMRYLVKLVTPPRGLVLDPFTGSGSTGKAALSEGFNFVGAELTEEYLPIIEGRLKWAVDNREDKLF